MIRFIASLKQSNWIKFEIPASDIEEAIKLRSLTGKAFRVNIFEVDENQK